MNECNNSACTTAPDTEGPSRRRRTGVWDLPDPEFSDDPYGDAVDRAWEEVRDDEDI